MHTFTKSLTFTPLSKGRYRCNQSGQILTQKQIIGYVYGSLNSVAAKILKIGHGSSKPPKKAQKPHPSKYASKHK
jgi:hypothetical protein